MPGAGQGSAGIVIFGASSRPSFLSSAFPEPRAETHQKKKLFQEKGDELEAGLFPTPILRRGLGPSDSAMRAFPELPSLTRLPAAVCGRHYLVVMPAGVETP